MQTSNPTILTPPVFFVRQDVPLVRWKDSSISILLTLPDTSKSKSYIKQSTNAVRLRPRHQKVEVHDRRGNLPDNVSRSSKSGLSRRQCKPSNQLRQYPRQRLRSLGTVYEADFRKPGTAWIQGRRKPRLPAASGAQTQRSVPGLHDHVNI
ncbi:hypothetical protein BC937DRAFT_94545 [Endogone sp. FLAS-F59071]|nr:hypothetical protein BC937DRAFT_94545 [Endogone sp. FLAS-F59071]|eukprot:RUS20712.1 hypothetical protein BC937DRAFT_94545 [Endogone sp. FLAS-F59071]